MASKTMVAGGRVGMIEKDFKAWDPGRPRLVDDQAVNAGLIEALDDAPSQARRDRRVYDTALGVVARAGTAPGRVALDNLTQAVDDCFGEGVAARQSIRRRAKEWDMQS